MKLVGRILKRRIAALALALGLLAGGAIAAVAATGSGSGSPAPLAGASTHQPLLLQTAADYLGVTREQLQRKLGSGQSLAQIAAAAGKPQTGLEQALGRVATSRLEQRSRSAPGAHRRQHARLHRHRLRLAAAAYLGLTPAALAQQLRSGVSLAQIADRTPGHSAAGLVDALLQSRLTQIKAAKPGAGRDAARLAKLRRRITALVEKTHGANRGSHTGTGGSVAKPAAPGPGATGR